MVRTAQLEDVHTLLDFGGLFHEQAKMSIYPLDRGHLAQQLRRMIRSKGAEILIAHVREEIVGAIGYTIVPSFFSRASKTAFEQFFWVHPEYRGSSHGSELLACMEVSAQMSGATHIGMVALHNEYREFVENFYEAQGYSPLEHVFVKALY